MKQNINGYFCLDIGGTGTRGALLNSSGKKLAHAEAKAGALSLGIEQTQDAIQAIWDRIISSLEPNTWRKGNVALKLAQGLRLPCPLSRRARTSRRPLLYRTAE